MTRRQGTATDRKRWVFCLLAISLVLLSACTRKTAAPEQTAGVSITPFREFVDEYFRGYFSFYPSEGTSAGFQAT